MKHCLRVALLLSIAGCASGDAILRPVPGVELARLTERTWEAFAPRGKEVDCIYGDTVLRNENIVVVIADPLPGRNANMTTRSVGGGIIDLTRRDWQRDQLTAYYPGWPGAGRAQNYEKPLLAPSGDGDRVVRHPKSISFSCALKGAAGQPRVEVRYTLESGAHHVRVETLYSNPDTKPVSFDLMDLLRADRSFQKTPNGKTDLFWVYDKWFGQAYGILSPGHRIQCASETRYSRLRFLSDAAPGEEAGRKTLGPSQKFTLVRQLFPGHDLIQVKAIAAALRGRPTVQVIVEVLENPGGRPVPNADVVLKRDGKPYASGRTEGLGRLPMEVPEGTYEMEVSALGRGSKTLTLAAEEGKEIEVELSEPGTVVGKIRDAKGGPVPCKVEFIGKDGTKSPFFGPDSGIHSVHNLTYSHNGSFRRIIGPGTYDVIVSHGPEYDAVFTGIKVERGKESVLEATLVRSVKSDGWVSADFHSHSTPSGDNTCHQRGRVLNLLCENIEFAPCTEHNRLDSYAPHLKALGVEHLMATCVGMELTSRPGSVNHQNAFPLVLKPRTQDGGGPLIDADPEVQIKRLALWDGDSEKLVQLNHPNLVQVFTDRNMDGKPDGGYGKMAEHMDVMEVHPPHTIIRPPDPNSRRRNNRMLNWMQLLNRNYRIPGVVNTDAHYAVHGSGWLRNYVKSSTDDPAKIDTMEMVRASEKGNLVMTNGPFLEVEAFTDGARAIPGDDLYAPDGKPKLRVRVQCPNWFDVDRVQVFLNGRAAASLNFTRASHPKRFKTDTVQFDGEIALQLSGDTHVIVVTAGETSKLGPVMGPRRNNIPVAVANPIFVDVDGGGFKPNGDPLK